ncbi:hypothetical protein OG345_41005 (plasmid) [Streptomyces sp. NBC_01220]|uniref:hypothetical protein n=1 Tax=Streptomyces sp. NBC_01220 TaxID=2903781 RepID=UPI002F917F3F|nr:hypothetical protein OG345_41005 [Streptomyces sp. NBC_01220]
MSTITNTYGTAHHVSEDHPAHVTSCDTYRLPLVATIAPGNPGYEDMAGMLRDNGHENRMNCTECNISYVAATLDTACRSR